MQASWIFEGSAGLVACPLGYTGGDMSEGELHVTTDIQAGSPHGGVPPVVVAARPGAADTPAAASTAAADGGGDPRRDAAACLRSARRERGWSLEELSERTCIKAQRLAEIEQGRVDSCGAAVYARGHLRAIAGALRLDPQPVIEALGSPTTPPGLC